MSDIEIVVDADACPVKDEIYRVARRYELSVTLVANVPFSIPEVKQSWLRSVLVNGRLDAADDWIAEYVHAKSVVITSDIPLAARCLENGASALDVKGNAFSEDHIGEALAHRDMADKLREMGISTKGPAPFEKKDRSRFLQTLDQIIQSLFRDSGP